MWRSTPALFPLPSLPGGRPYLTRRTPGAPLLGYTPQEAKLANTQLTPKHHRTSLSEGPGRTSRPDRGIHYTNRDKAGLPRLPSPKGVEAVGLRNVLTICPKGVGNNAMIPPDSLPPVETQLPPWLPRSPPRRALRRIPPPRSAPLAALLRLSLRLARAIFSSV